MNHNVMMMNHDIVPIKIVVDLFDFCVFRKDFILSTFDIGQYCYAIDFTDCFLKRQTGNFPVS